MTGFDALAARLLGAARRLAEARLRSARLERTDPARRWRDPALVWPRFTKGQP